MGTGRMSFRRALEDEIRRNAVEEEKFYLNRQDVEEIGESVGLGAEQSARQFFRLAGSVWVGWIWPENGPNIPTYTSPQGVDPNWLGVGFDLPEMQRMGKIPYGLDF